MKQTHLYLIRHGESEANARHLFIGHTDMGLTEKGHLQAEKTAAFLESVPADVIYASDLSRAYQTAMHTASRRGIPAVSEAGLREIFAGEWEGKSFDDLPVLYPHDFAELWRCRIGDCRCTGGESVTELAERIKDTVDRLVKRHIGQTLLLFTHATPIRALGTLWSGLPLSEMHTVPWAANASVTHAVYDGESYRLVYYGKADFQVDPE